MIAGLAHSLWSITNLNTQIVHNNVKLTLAKTAAQSGINHFIALNLTAEDIAGRFLIPETRLSSNSAYEVEAVWLNDNDLLVTSLGKYKKGSKTLFYYPVRAVFAK